MLYFNPIPVPAPIIESVERANTTTMQIHKYYERQLEECHKCKPMVLQNNGLFKEMKHKTFMKYLKQRQKLYSHDGLWM